MTTSVFVQQVYGAAYAGSERCIAALLTRGLEERLAWLDRFGLAVEYAGVLVEPGELGELPSCLETASSRLPWGKSRVLIIGSDHSMTSSVVRGAVAALPGRTLGLLHFDAHGDLEGPSRRNAHASVITELTMPWDGSDGAIRPEHVVQIGIRDFSREELTRAGRLRRVISANEVGRRGIAPTLREACDDLASVVDSIYVTVDLDVVSMAEFPAVNTPKPGGGLALGELSVALELLGGDSRVVGLDLVEYNPANDDPRGNGAKTLFELVASALGYQALLAMKSPDV